jgi:hypothetical protein
VTITEEPAPVVQKKVYDLMDDLLEADVLKVYRQVLAEEEALVKAGGQTQFGYLPRMTLANIGAMNAESFCERTLSLLWNTCVESMIICVQRFRPLKLVSPKNYEIRMKNKLERSRSTMDET